MVCFYENIVRKSNTYPNVCFAYKWTTYESGKHICVLKNACIQTRSHAHTQLFALL